MMFERLSEFVNRHEELSLLINDPDIIADQGKWRGLMKEYSDITPIAEKYTEYKNTKKNIEEAIEMLEEKPDEELKSLLKDELSENRERLAEIEEELKLLLIPEGPQRRQERHYGNKRRSRRGRSGSFRRKPFQDV